MENLNAVARLKEIVARLRAPDGCPWDREQTHASLRRFLLEETYEALEALDSGDVFALEEELGDLLLQIVFHAQIGAENGMFDFGDVVAAITGKMIRRHPHVFGGASAKTSAAPRQALPRSPASRPSRRRTSRRWSGPQET